MAKKNKNDVVLVLCRAESLEPDSAPYKPTKPVLCPECWVQIPVPLVDPDTEVELVVGEHEDGLPILTLEGWAYLLAEAAAAQSTIYG